MGGSNSKNEKRPKIQTEKINQIKFENTEKENKEEKIDDDININFICTANNIKEEKISNNNNINNNNDNKYNNNIDNNIKIIIIILIIIMIIITIMKKIMITMNL